MRRLRLARGLVAVACVAATCVARAQDADDPGALHEQALRAPPAEQRRLLLESARRGGLEAAARLIEVGARAELRALPLDVPALRAWRDAPARRAGDLDAGLVFAFCQAVQAAATGPPYQGEALARLVEARARLDAAERGGGLQPVLAAELSFLWRHAAPADEARARALLAGLSDRLAARARERDPLARGALLQAAASVRAQEGVPPGQRAWLHAQAANAFAEAGDEAGQGRALADQAACFLAQQDHARAEVLYGRAAPLLARAGAAAEAGDAYAQLGWCLTPTHNARGSWRRAAEAYQRAVEELERPGGAAPLPAALARVLHRWGHALEPGRNPAGSWSQAAERQRRAAELFAGAGDRAAEGAALEAWAGCVAPDRNALGSWDEAARLYGRAIEAYTAAGDARALPLLRRHGHCLSPERNPAGSWTRAAEAYARAAAAARAANDGQGELEALFEQAACLDPARNPDGSYRRVAEVLATACERARALGDVRGQVVALLGQAFAASPEHDPGGSWDRAAELYRRVATDFEQNLSPETLGWTLFERARCMAHCERARLTPEGRALVERARDLGTQAGDEALVRAAREWLAPP